MSSEKWGGSTSGPRPIYEHSGEQANVASKESAERVVEKFNRHKKNGGRVYLVAGPSGHGKSVFTWRLKQFITKQKYRAFSPASDKTPGGAINFMDIPGHPIFFDIAGEDFSKMAHRSGFNGFRTYFEHFLWPVLRVVNGLVLYVSFPAFWLRYNQALGKDYGEEVPDREAVDEAIVAEEEAAEAFQRLLEMTLLSRDIDRLTQVHPRYFPDDRLPSYENIRERAQQAAALDLPVFVALGEADVLDHPLLWPDGMEPPPSGGVGRLGVRVKPERIPPRTVVKERMNHLYEHFLSHQLQNVAFGYVQSLDGSDEVQNPIELDVEKASIESLIGAETVVEFLDDFPWQLLPPLVSARRFLQVQEASDGQERWAEW